MTSGNVLRDFVERRIRLLDEIDAIKDTLKELDLQAKAEHGINTRELHRWANAERKDKVGKLIEQVYASVQYGEALGHDVLGDGAKLLQHSDRQDKNVSNSPVHSGETVDPETGEIITEQKGVGDAGDTSPLGIAPATPEGSDKGGTEHIEPDATPAGAVVAERSGVTSQGGENPAPSTDDFDQPPPIPACLDRRNMAAE